MFQLDEMDPLLGQLVGSWRVSRLLGQGGMGRVYLAIQPSIGSRVALKVLSGQIMSRELVERFFAEARAVNLIRHENIVNVIDLGSLPDGRPYIVMEYLSGASLRQIMRRRPQLPLGSFARVMVEALGALAAAHAKGIIHRDLKPDNIQITPGGHAVVLDFGIAKLTTGDTKSPATQSGALMGTPPYMSPEQAAEEPLGPASDLYSMGIILYEGVTGGRPFTGSTTFEMLHAHLMAPPPSPRERRPELPAAFEAVILRALAKKPADRFASASEMASALEAAVAELPAAAFSSLGVASGAFEVVADAGLATDAAKAAAGAAEESQPPPVSAPEPPATVALKPRSSPGSLERPSAPKPTPEPATRPEAAAQSEPAAQPEAAARPEPAKLGSGPLEPAAKPEPRGPITASTSASQRWPLLVLSLAVAGLAAVVLWSRLAPRHPAAPPRESARPSPVLAPPDAAPLPVLQPLRTTLTHYDDNPHLLFDVETGIRMMQHQARELVDDADLVHVQADNVDQKGFSDLALGNQIEYMYRSESRSVRVPGAPGARRCMIALIASKAGIDRVEVPDRDCDEPVVRAPTCTPATIVKRILGPKAKPDRTLSLRYMLSGTPAKPRWISTDPLMAVDDDCGP